MAIRKSLPFSFAFLAVMAVALANRAADGSSFTPAGALETAERVPTLKYYPTRCYRRTQFCCYKFVKCGVHCKIVRCYTARKCILRNPITNKCLRYKSIKHCVKRCYVKLCRRFRCSPLRIIRHRSYLAPKSFILGKKTSDEKVKSE